MQTLVAFLVGHGHSYAKAHEIALDAVRGEPYAVSWVVTLSNADR